MSAPPSWLAVVTVSDEDMAQVSDELDVGERAAIAIAQRMRADLLLIDETAGSAEARRRSLRVTGTLGVLRAGASRLRGCASTRCAARSLKRSTRCYHY